MGEHGHDDHGHDGHGHDDTAASADDKHMAPPCIFRWKVSAAMLAIIVIALVIPYSGTTPPSDIDDAHKVTANAVLLSLTALVIIAVVFELGHHHLHHHTPAQFAPVLHAISSELMGVGFLAVIFYMMIKFGLLKSASEATICQNCNPCGGKQCMGANFTQSGLSNHYYPEMNHASLKDPVTKKYVFKPPSRRLSEVSDADFHKHMLWRTNMLPAALQRPVGGGRRLAGGVKVERAVGYYANASSTYKGKPIEIESWNADGTPKWKMIAGTTCEPLQRRLGESIEAHHERAWGVDVWKRWQGTNGNPEDRDGRSAGRRRLGGAGNPYYTCECMNCDIKLIILYENVHMGLFLVLVLYFVRAVLLLRQVMAIGNGWKKTESVIETKGEEEIVKRYYEQGGKNGTEHEMEYLMLRKRFVKTGDGGKPLEGDFSFAEYLSIILGHTTAHMVHIPPRAWVVLELFFVLFWAAMNTDTNRRARVFVLYVWILFGCIALLWRKLRVILVKLTPTWPDPAPGTKYEINAEFMAKLEESHPPYLSRKVGDHHANPQTALFWFGSPRFGKHAGPGFIMHMIRLSVVAELIFTVLLIVAGTFVSDEDPNYLAVVLIMLVPTLGMCLFSPQRMLKMYAMVTSVELTKNPHAIEETIRKVKFSKSIRTIKLLKSLQSVAQMQKTKEGGPSMADVDLGPETDEELERKVQMKEVFEMFDESGDGEVDMDELSGLMSAIGVEFSDDDKKLLMENFDKSGDGQISFDEFWQYMRGMTQPSDPATIVQDVFSLIDKDGSGSITAEEFATQLRALPVEISDQDIEALVRECDESGDGEIDLHEFSDVLAKYQ